MAKQKCPSCGKSFDFEKCDYICPRCGSIVFRSDTSYTAYTAEDAFGTKRQNHTADGDPNPYASDAPFETQDADAQPFSDKSNSNPYTSAGPFPNDTAETWRQPTPQPKKKKCLSWLVIVILAICVVISGINVFRRAYSGIFQSGDSQTGDAGHIRQKNVSCGESIEIDPFIIRIDGIAWADELDGFPTEIQTPEGGRYLTVSYTYLNDAADDEYPADVLWCCLDTGEGCLLPLNPNDYTDDTGVRETLRNDFGIGVPLDEERSRLIFLVKEDTAAENLSLRLYAGRSDAAADACYTVTLTEEANGDGEA